jgi:hypothetical protein
VNVPFGSPGSVVEMRVHGKRRDRGGPVELDNLGQTLMHVFNPGPERVKTIPVRYFTPASGGAA